MTEPFRLQCTLPGLQPVFCTADHLYLFRRGYLYQTDHRLGVRTRLARIPDDRPLLSRSPRIVERIFRTAVQSAVQCDPNTLLLARRGKIWRVALNTGAVTLDHILPDGRSLLALNRIRSATGADWLVFGEYFHNPERVEVRLWRRSCTPDGRWEVFATFPAGEIDHVHTIQQLGNGRSYVLTGDFDAAAGAWEVDVEHGDLRPIMRGDQRFRACWWFERNGEVIYGTDSQFERNTLLALQPGENDPRSVADLPGSCIYHGRTGGDLTFSTTVEPGETTESFTRDLLDRSVGPGITGDPAIFHYDGSLDRIFSAPKDAWPPRLGQFGTFMFPTGTAPDGRIYAYGVAVKGYDGACLVFDRQ